MVGWSDVQCEELGVKWTIVYIWSVNYGAKCRLDRVLFATTQYEGTVKLLLVYCNIFNGLMLNFNELCRYNDLWPSLWCYFVLCSCRTLIFALVYTCCIYVYIYIYSIRRLRINYQRACLVHCDCQALLSSLAVSSLALARKRQLSTLFHKLSRIYIYYIFVIIFIYWKNNKMN